RRTGNRTRGSNPFSSASLRPSAPTRRAPDGPILGPINVEGDAPDGLGEPRQPGRRLGDVVPTAHALVDVSDQSILDGLVHAVSVEPRGRRSPRRPKLEPLRRVLR